MNALTNADTIEVESATVEGGEKQGNTVSDGEADIDAGRWSNYGKDRLYINDGISKADKHSLHVDLQSNEVVSDNEHCHEGEVEVDGDTATVTIRRLMSGKTHSEYTIELAVEWED